MIEEIAKPELIILLVPLVLACIAIIIMGAMIGSFFTKPTVLVSFLIVGAIALVLLMWLAVVFTAEWRESVYDQINALPCEDLQKAYEIYEIDYIKEKYTSECVDDWEWWR